MRTLAQVSSELLFGLVLNAGGWLKKLQALLEQGPDGLFCHSPFEGCCSACFALALERGRLVLLKRFPEEVEAGI